LGVRDAPSSPQAGPAGEPRAGPERVLAPHLHTVRSKRRPYRAGTKIMKNTSTVARDLLGLMFESWVDRRLSTSSPAATDGIQSRPFSSGPSAVALCRIFLRDSILGGLLLAFGLLRAAWRTVWRRSYITSAFQPERLRRPSIPPLGGRCMWVNGLLQKIPRKLPPASSARSRRRGHR